MIFSPQCWPHNQSKPREIRSEKRYLDVRSGRLYQRSVRHCGYVQRCNHLFKEATYLVRFYAVLQTRRQKQYLFRSVENEKINANALKKNAVRCKCSSTLQWTEKIAIDVSLFQ